MPSPDADLARRALEAFSRRDRSALLELLHPKIEFISITGRLTREGRPYRGTEEMDQYLDDISEVWDELRVTPIEFRPHAEGVVVLGRVYARRGQYVEDSPVAWVIRIEGGLLRHVEVFESPREALRAISGPPR